MNTNSALGLSRNPFATTFLLSKSFPWQRPRHWQLINGPDAVVVYYHQLADAILTARAIHREKASGVRSLLVPILQGDTDSIVLERASHIVAKWWIKYLADDLSPLVTGPLSQSLLLMRLLVWSQGSLEALEFTLRAQSASYRTDTRVDAVQHLVNELHRKRDKIMVTGNDSLLPIPSWLALKPVSYRATQLLLIQFHNETAVESDSLLRTAFYDSSLIIKFFLGKQLTPYILDELPIVPLDWKVNDLVNMVDAAVGQVTEGQSFDGLRGMPHANQEMYSKLGSKYVLDFLAECAKGSITRLMAYCNVILRKYHKRIVTEGEEADKDILKADVESALSESGLLNG